MKKTLLFLLLGLVTYGQQFVSVLPNNGSTSGNARAPQGAVRYARTCYIISPAEMTASGFPNATAVSALSFEFGTAQDIATSGTLKIYIQNTSDATYLKASNVWTDVINGMTMVHNAPTTIPAATGFWDITLTGGTPFTYTGGGVYVAFEWENPTNPLSTANVALCNTTIVGGLRNEFNNSALAASLVNTSNWRPATRFAFTASCVSPTAVTSTNITTTSATVNFTGTMPAPANGYEYFVSTSSTAPSASTTPTGTTTSNSIALTGLSHTTTYYVWVRSACSVSEKSVWTSAHVFHTIAQAPFEYGFENPLHPGWTLFNAGTGNNWGIGSTAGFAATGTNYAVYGFNATNAANAWLFSRAISLTAGIQYTITFKVRARMDGTVMYPESMKATIGTTNTVAAQTTILWDSGLNGINYETYTTQTGTFTPATTGSYVLGFHCYSVADMFQLLLDDVFVNVPLNLDENNLNNVSIYPVPVYDGFYIKATNLDVTGVNVYDLNGRLVKSFQSAIENYNISELNSGIYMVEIKNGEETQMKKIIKK